MFHYRAFGVTIRSSFDLPTLNCALTPASAAALTVEACNASPGFVSRWIHEWRLGRDLPRVSFGRTHDGYLVRFDALIDFVVSDFGTEIRCPDPASHPTVPIEHLLLDQVVPLALARQGHLVLHASAVHVPGFGAYAILGRSRRGKSTLASALARHGEIVADDCLRIDAGPFGFQALPSYPGLRLWPGAGPKRRVNGEDITFRSDGSPLRGIFVLGTRTGRGPAAWVRPMPAARAFVELARHQFQLDVTDRNGLGRSFQVLSGLAVAVPVFRLRVRDGLDAISEAADEVVEYLAAS